MYCLGSDPNVAADASEEAKAEGRRQVARSRVETRLVAIHTAWKDGQLLGYAHIDVHTVRTKPEGFMVVLGPDGIVDEVKILAFYEPLEYLPGDRWLEQLSGRSLTDDLLVGRAIAGITGSTLSSHAVVLGIRRTLALHEVLHGDAQADEAETSDRSGENETVR